MTDTEIVDWLEKNLKEGALDCLTASDQDEDNLRWRSVCLDWGADREQTEAPTLGEVVKNAIEEQAD